MTLARFGDKRLAGAIVLSPHREDVGPSARRRGNCRPFVPTHDPLLSAARVDAHVRPTNGPGIFPQTDWPSRHRDRYPIGTLHPDAEAGRIAALLSRISILAL